MHKCNKNILLWNIALFSNKALIVNILHLRFNIKYFPWPLLVPGLVKIVFSSYLLSIAQIYLTS